jgi:hypothetical protein
MATVRHQRWELFIPHQPTDLCNTEHRQRVRDQARVHRSQPTGISSHFCPHAGGRRWKCKPAASSSPSALEHESARHHGHSPRGQTLAASTGSWSSSPTSYWYQWFRCDGAGGTLVALANSYDCRSGRDPSRERERDKRAHARQDTRRRDLYLQRQRLGQSRLLLHACSYLQLALSMEVALGTPPLASILIVHATPWRRRGLVAEAPPSFRLNHGSACCRYADSATPLLIASNASLAKPWSVLLPP